MEGIRLPLDKRPRRPKPTTTPQQFNQLVQLVSEPYATMIYVAVWTGLRVSEVIGLKWRCIHDDSITIEERYCRGDWSVSKTDASAATIGVEKQVIARLLRRKNLTVEVRAGRAVRKYKLVKSAGPDDLVFQSVKGGHPMNDQNILKRHVQPAAETRITLRQLAVPTYIARDLVGSGWSRSKERAGPNAAFAHIDHDGYLRSDRAGSAAPCIAATFTFCFTVQFGPIRGLSWR